MVYTILNYLKSNVLQIIAIIVPLLSFIFTNSIHLTIEELDSTKTCYFYPPLDCSGGNTSSMYIEILVKNISKSPVSIVSVELLDNYDYRKWFPSQEWNDVDYITEAVYCDGVFTSDLSSYDRFPMTLQGNESKIIRVLFPIAGNNYNLGDPVVDENGFAIQLPFTIRTNFAFRGIFRRRKSTKIKGMALVSKRIPKSISKNSR